MSAHEDDMIDADRHYNRPPYCVNTYSLAKPKKLYVIAPTTKVGESAVVKLSTKKPVFYGTPGECKAWVEVNGHDEWN